MHIIKQQYLGEHRLPDGKLASVTQNVWDTAPIDYSLSWQNGDGFYEMCYVPYCPPIEVWPTPSKVEL